VKKFVIFKTQKEILIKYCSKIVVLRKKYKFKKSKIAG